MKEDLINYLNKRSKEVSTKNEVLVGPLVTISREKGCPANSVALKLSERLIKSGEVDWRWVNKLILEESAKELHMNPSKINHVLYSEDKGFFRDLMLSFGEHYYESDEHVKRTIGDLVQEFGSQGKVILVGLGAVAITKNFTKAFHIKLYASKKYRLQKVMEKERMNAEKAEEYMEETDINRKMIIDYFNGLKAGDDLYHMQFNCETMTEDEIVESIIGMMQLRKLI